MILYATLYLAKIVANCIIWTQYMARLDIICIDIYIYVVKYMAKLVTWQLI